MLVLSFGLATPVSANSINVPGDYTTIQEAIDAASPGDVISVGAGTYAEDLVIAADKTGLELAGSDATIKGVAMTPAAEFPTVAPNINVLADGVSISGFTIQGPAVTPGFYSSGICIGGSDVEIYGNDFEVTNTADGTGGDIGQAIQTYNKLAIPGVDISGLNIHDNTFTSYGEGAVGFEGIYINRDAGTGSISIGNNVFSGVIVRAITTERSNAVVGSNDILASDGWAWTGVLVMDVGSGEPIDSVAVTGNTIVGLGNGVKIGDGAGEDTLTNLAVLDNTITGSIKGVYVRTAEDVTIAGNAVSDTTGGADSVAISVGFTESAAVLANTISNFEKGGIVVKDTVAVLIEDNIVSTTSVALASNGIQVGYDMDPTATTGTIKGNLVTGCLWDGYDPLTEMYEDDWTSSGILVIAPNSALEISGNEVQNNDVGMDIEAGIDTSIEGNDVHDNSYGIVFWNANPAVNLNSIYRNTLEAVYRPYDLTGTLDAENNWWGQSSGPAEGAVSIDVDVAPWLLAEGGEQYDRTMVLNAGWSIVSPDAELDSYDIVDSVGLVLAYDDGAFVRATALDPVIPVFIKTADGGGIGFNYVAESMGIFSTDLEAGWNLIGIPETDAAPDDILSSIRLGANNEVALATLASQGAYNPSGESFYESMLDVEYAPEELFPFDGYWAYMNVAKEFGVIVVTP